MAIQMRNITRLCETKSVITVNGKFPGPRIIAREGDLALILSVFRVGMEFGNFKVDGLMGRHTSPNARFKRVDHTFTTLPLRAKLEHYGIMPMFHGLGLPYMARSSFSLNIMNRTRLSNHTWKSRSYLENGGRLIQKLWSVRRFRPELVQIVQTLILLTDSRVQQ
uniref:Plastocyanin-like domain-containing protein n=1 Tax=Lactuca sativa TaxID=4236 RepID=A0A9R1UVH3_LACSA|nr:hypothetical protein LSAT_V11C800418280 [Lactuca sativa]